MRILKYSSTLVFSLALAALFSVLGVVCEITIAYEFGEIAKILLQRLSTASIPGRIAFIAGASILLALSVAIASLLARIESRKVKVNLRRSIVDELARVASISSFQNFEEGTTARIERSKLITLSTLGSDQVGLYVSDYLPAMVSAVVVPGGIFLYIATRDLLSLLIEAATFLSIPPLMIIFGRVADRRSQSKWRSMLRLSQQFGEFIGAMMTFKGLRAEDRAKRLIDSASNALLRDTMSTLYLAFISGAVLEIISMVAIALVAVVMGVRLTHGSMDVGVAITILILAPRPYMAIRSAAGLFHTNVDAAVALDDAPDIAAHVSVESGSTLLGQRFEAVQLGTRFQRYQGSVSFALSRGDVQFIVGNSGIGKTSLLRALVGLERLVSGAILIDGEAIAEMDSRTFASIFSYLPQRAPRLSGSVMDNIDLNAYDNDRGARRFDEQKLRSVLYSAALIDSEGDPLFDLQAPIDDLGMAISAGQMRRVALARTLLNGGPILVLDEPTANLDRELASEVMDRLRTFAKDKILVVVTHDESLIREGDCVLRIGGEGERSFGEGDGGVLPVEASGGCEK